jgi:hypothetical protein
MPLQAIYYEKSWSYIHPKSMSASPNTGNSDGKFPHKMLKKPKNLNIPLGTTKISSTSIHR